VIPTSIEIENINADLLSGDKELIVSALDRLDNHLRKEGGDPTVIDALNGLLESDLDIRRKASWALGKTAQVKVGSESSIEPLTALLDDEDEEVRENAAWALGELAGMGKGSASSVPPLVSLLSDEGPQVRSMSAWTLGRLAGRAGICPPGTKEAVTALLEDSSQLVRKSAAWSLEKM
jgi:HEAT repeat protein